MDKRNDDAQPTEYAKPAIKDYGTLQELTASGGGGFTDTPMGTPTPNITAGSTP